MPDTIASDPIEFPLASPTSLSFSGNDNLGVWHFSDGMVVIRVGSAKEIGAETIALKRHQVGPIWRALKAIDEANSTGDPQ